MWNRSRPGLLPSWANCDFVLHLVARTSFLADRAGRTDSVPAPGAIGFAPGQLPCTEHLTDECAQFGFGNRHRAESPHRSDWRSVVRGVTYQSQMPGGGTPGTSTRRPRGRPSQGSARGGSPHPGTPRCRCHLLTGAQGVDQSNAKSVTIHRALGWSWCPLAVTRTPSATPKTSTAGATHRRRPSILIRRRPGSQALIDPVMRNRRGIEDTIEVNDRGTGGLAVGRSGSYGTEADSTPAHRPARAAPESVFRGLQSIPPPDVPSSARLAPGAAGRRRDPTGRASSARAPTRRSTGGAGGTCPDRGSRRRGRTPARIPPRRG